MQKPSRSDGIPQTENRSAISTDVRTSDPTIPDPPPYRLSLFSTYLAPFPLRPSILDAPPFPLSAKRTTFNAQRITFNANHPRRNESGPLDDRFSSSS